MAAVAVGVLSAEGGDLDLVRGNEDNAEGGADEVGAGEQRGDLAGEGRGGDVVLVHGAAKQAVAHAAADEEGGVPCRAKAAQNGECGRKVHAASL